MNTSAIFQNNAMLITFDGNTHSIDDSHPHYDEIYDFLKSGEYEQARKLCEVSFEIVNWGDGEITVQGGEISFLGRPLGDLFTRRIIQMMDENQDRDPLKLFLGNLFKNPSNRSIEQVPEFVYACDLPITTDGCILTYKKVNDDFTDFHSGKFDNSPGQIVEEDRRFISDDPTQTCSHGLHVCSWHYINPNGGRMFGRGKMILCKVDPADIVCVPVDYERTKMRVCKYEVLEEINVEDPTEIYERESVWSIKPEYEAPSYEEDDYDYDEDEDYDEFDYDEDEIEDVEEDIEVDIIEDEVDDEVDVESDAEKRHALRNANGQFCKAEDVPQPRDSKGRFMSKLFGKKGKK